MRQPSGAEITGPVPEAGAVDVDVDIEDVVAARHRLVPAPVFLIGLSLTVVLVAMVSAAMGAYDVSVADVVATLGSRTGLMAGPADALDAAVIWDIRLPRVALAVGVGAALAVAGAAMQGSFANPLAEPGIVGTSAGAAVGAMVAILAGGGFLGLWATPAGAFVGASVAVAVVYSGARSNGRTEVVTLVLTGIAVNAMAGAMIGLGLFMSDDGQVRSITFWQLGSLAQASWARVGLLGLLAGVGIAAALVVAPRLDLLALGERPAAHLGVAVERLRTQTLVIVAVLTAAAVSVAGIVVFVGLVVPHLVRMAMGPSHRVLMAGSALGGALLVLACDMVARTIAAPAEVPLGVMTGLIGGPFFFWLLRRTRARQGGWA